MMFLLAYGAFSARSFLRLLATRPDPKLARSIYQLELAFYEAMPKSRTFLENLKGDLSVLERRGGPIPTFKDGFFPRYLDPVDFAFSRYSQIFKVLEARATFVDRMRAEYTVREDGHVVVIHGSRIPGSLDN